MPFPELHIAIASDLNYLVHAATLVWLIYEHHRQLDRLPVNFNMECCFRAGMLQKIYVSFA